MTQCQGCPHVWTEHQGLHCPICNKDCWVETPSIKEQKCGTDGYCHCDCGLHKENGNY